ncbi:flagellar hook-basal body complex protein FliE [Variovorax sp. RKNM96]|uniref:flagellar hook-basal body complex protein FliE n=1 Tax=Variovorax sp. RKNM96 TaxID=2681552 RepID=UPI001980E240|nr:flagellar hook-basal body complex protein FliE [Variovorax sp. RKNM96]QSI29797.1 flagellar hook-basal body complex protein FliE [Variovorax sp. RKNM96]
MTAFIPVEALSSLSQQAQAMLAANQPAMVQSEPSMPSAAGSASATGSFGQLVSNGLAQVNNQLIGSQVDLQKLAVGDAQNLHQIMINLEESRLSFQLMMQVRSRLLEAYQDIMKMPI